MIHKIERGESSPTAVLLARLSGSFDMTISQLLAQTEVQTGTLVRHENQPVWQDPETGYLRRHVSPGEMPVDLVSVELPANTAVPMPAISYVSRRQLIWVIEGTLTLKQVPAPMRWLLATVWNWAIQLIACSEIKRLRAVDMPLSYSGLPEQADGINP